jgi:hypothetical protein
MTEDPAILLKHIKEMYRIYEFDPPNAKQFVEEEA